MPKSGYNPALDTEGGTVAGRKTPRKKEAARRRPDIADASAPPSCALAAAPRPQFPRGRLAALAALLALAAILLYLPTLRHGYVFDDEYHITANPIVLDGLSGRGARWAFTTLSGTSWHPLTWLSYMAVIEAFGPGPAPQHLAGLLLHAANAALLLLALLRLTGAPGRSAFVAALFALHPLHVESVAWAAERKDVLYALFWILCLLACASHARRPGLPRYAALAGTFTLSLMSKPMAITLPLALLVLDGWPLGRAGVNRRPWGAALREKLPLLALSAGVAAITAVGGVESRTLVGLGTHSLAARLANVPVTYAMYLVQTLWPADLAVYYPLPLAGPPAWAWLSATAALAAITALAVAERRRRPWLLAGWAWYVITLLPVVGFAPIGEYARADRYTYLPLVGIFVIAAWGGRELFAGLRRAVPAAAATALVLLASLTAASRVQIGHWKDPLTLFGHALEVTEGNWMARYNVGVELQRRGRRQEAAAQYEETIRLNPAYVDAYNNLGVIRHEQGRRAEAEALLRRALQLSPGFREARLNLARLGIRE